MQLKVGRWYGPDSYVMLVYQGSCVMLVYSRLCSAPFEHFECFVFAVVRLYRETLDFSFVDFALTGKVKRDKAVNTSNLVCREHRAAIGAFVFH